MTGLVEQDVKFKIAMCGDRIGSGRDLTGAVRGARAAGAFGQAACALKCSF